jgi:hypothetical protein
MKKLVTLFALACITMCSCYFSDHYIHITTTDGDDDFYMNAHFSKHKTRELERYMDRVLGAQTKMSFVNSRIDGTIALDDHTIFYIEKHPGHIKIKLDKDRNSEESYEEIRDMCEGMKEMLTRGEY